jgi:hypothetical protein
MLKNGAIILYIYLCWKTQTLVWGVTKFTRNFNRFPMKLSKFHPRIFLMNPLCPLVIKDQLLQTDIVNSPTKFIDNEKMNL